MKTIFIVLVSWLKFIIYKKKEYLNTAFSMYVYKYDHTFASHFGTFYKTILYAENQYYPHKFF